MPPTPPTQVALLNNDIEPEGDEEFDNFLEIIITFTPHAYERGYKINDEESSSRC